MSKAGSTVAPSMASQGNKRAPSTALGDVPEASPATPEGSPASQGSTAPVGSLAGPGSLAGKSKAGKKTATTASPRPS
ncbi:hypothetical protein DIPPA_14556 [Diplonema papillatum]|nr:hypothetical protein DIPPA_14556 [Diplonema papillatum]